MSQPGPSGASVWTEDTPAPQPQQSYYEIIGIERDADADQIRRAYRKQALKCHPDKRGDDPVAAEQFQKLSKAYEVLSDEKKRQVYDKYGANGVEMMDKMPFLDVSVILAMKNFFFAITFVSAILLLFPVFVSMKIDGKIGWTWPIVFIPSFIVLGIVLIGALLAPVSGDSEDEDRSDKKASLLTRVSRKLYNIAYVACLTVFDVLISLRLESIISVNWGTVFVPWYLMEISHFASGVYSVFMRIREGVYEAVPENLDEEEQNPDAAKRAYTMREILVILYLEFHFLVFRVVQAVMFVSKLDSDSMSWQVTFTPLYILIIVNLIAMLISFLALSTRLPSPAEKRSACIIFMVVFVIIATIVSVFTYLLVRKVSGNDGYPPASVVLIPVFFIFALLLCCCGCFLPCVLGAGLASMEDMENEGAAGQQAGQPQQQGSLVPLGRRINYGTSGGGKADGKKRMAEDPSSSTLTNN
ncbi:hypothetical protein BJ741DRAFT_591802 [Chytriomyces cf. hyalinus JEL632]|nr:hypothetical protein BJ741DRAFT_591802 [Chytriomyces cf. hyalinus JEL632]